MQSTYTVSEIKSIIRSLDFSSVQILKELVEEEKNEYFNYELKAIFKFISLKNREIVRNEVNPEFLLSFN